MRLTILTLCTSFFLALDLEIHQPYFRASAFVSKQATGSPTLPPISSDWVGSDGDGRVLPTHANVGSYKTDKYVGIFYFLWHGQYKDQAVYDISALAKANPSSPHYGPETSWHWWGEPEAGYYRADDPWVIRRNLQMLTLAGVDILFLDATNTETYPNVVKKLCEISVEMRHKGIPTPYICFVTNEKSGRMVMTLYEEIYAKNRYAELWFRWQDKPLILGKIAEVSDAQVRNFFTWRYSWAWTNTRNEPHHWQWLDRTPQNYGWDKNPAIPEEIPVALASHPYDNSIGKSSRKGRVSALNRNGTTAQTQQGLYFDEQWKQALNVNPEVVFVTGWNEWIAQRFVYRPDSLTKRNPARYMGKPLKPNQTFFVDLYNQEYNRDAEPMKGGYTDNYYYQLVANIRRFKGTPVPTPASSPKTVSIDGNFDEWASVKPDFTDPAGDVAHRDWPRVDNEMNYVNKTGRNDIVICKVTNDAINTYFYVRTDRGLTPSTSRNWMLLLIDTDQTSKTGWAGYDVLINRSVLGDKTTIARWNGKNWSNVASSSLRYANNELELAVPLAAIKQKPNKVSIDFHWADNIQLNSISNFFINGDSAPDRRFNYRYVGR